ncbi:MAG: ABC-type transport auxiliary lipoprotein family protein [Burkholderiales bacterium]|nr:ABC-type transport auxiliary lipoprotein family protein [Burkholderiales bacterium]
MYKKLILACIALGLTGCSLLPERPPLNYFGLILDPPPASMIKKNSRASIRINPPTVSEAYGTSRFYIRGEGEQFYQSDENRYLTQPSELIGEAIRNWFSQTGPWKTVLSPNSIAPTSYQMIVYVPQFYTNASVNPPVAEISMEISVISSTSGSLVFHKNYKAETPVTENSANGLALAFKQSLTQILEEMTPELQKKF